MTTTSGSERALIGSQSGPGAGLSGLSLSCVAVVVFSTSQFLHPHPPTPVATSWKVLAGRCLARSRVGVTLGCIREVW